jgi:hypothetical protein
MKNKPGNYYVLKFPWLAIPCCSTDLILSCKPEALVRCWGCLVDCDRLTSSWSLVLANHQRLFFLFRSRYCSTGGHSLPTTKAGGVWPLPLREGRKQGCGTYAGEVRKAQAFYYLYWVSGNRAAEGTETLSAWSRRTPLNHIRLKSKISSLPQEQTWNRKAVDDGSFCCRMAGFVEIVLE